MELHLPGDPKKTEEYKTRLDASFVRASGGDDQSLRHHRPTKKKDKNTKCIRVLFNYL